jgi:hypothetical protein
MELTNYLWLGVVAGGPLLLGLLLAYALLRRRRLTGAERAESRQATEKLYRDRPESRPQA